MHIGTAYREMNNTMAAWRAACRKVADIDHDLKMDAIDFVRNLHGIKSTDTLTSEVLARIDTRWKVLKRDSVARKEAIDAAQWAAAQHAMYAAHVTAACTYNDWMGLA